MKTRIASKNIIATIAVIVLLIVLAACTAPAPTATSAPQPTQAPAATSAPQPTTAPAVSASPTAAATGVLRYGLQSDPQNWTPYKVVDCQNMTVMSQIWSSLLRYDSQGQLAGDLAESWEWQDDKTGAG